MLDAQGAAYRYRDYVREPHDESSGGSALARRFLEPFVAGSEEPPAGGPDPLR